MKVIFLATGGTFDKLYYDALSNYKIGPPQVSSILERAGLELDYQIETMISKDSLDMNEADREMLSAYIKDSPHRRFIIIHGTDTMVESAQALGAITDKTIVLTGAMRPARFKDSDAEFNTGFALAAVQLLSPGVYIAMNGAVFTPDDVQKNRAAGRFETRGT